MSRKGGDDTERHYRHDISAQLSRALSSIERTRLATLRQLLSARGHYTVFAPTNEAIQHYLDTLCSRKLIRLPSWEGFPDEHVLDSIEKVIVYNSIIDFGDHRAPDNGP